ncbi:MAG TPA: nucleotidyltransferase family protein [Gemmatimonadales bacterium]
MPPDHEIDHRLARFVTSRNALDVWPGVSAVAFRAAQEQIAGVTSAVLRGAPQPIRLAAPPNADARAIGVAGFAGGMGPLLGYWCETGTIVAEPAVAQLLATHLDHARGRTERAHGVLERILARFDDLDIEVVLLRGTHTRYRYFPEPATRSASDIHLLVQPPDWERARGALQALGLAERAGNAHPDRSLWSPAGEFPVHALEFAHRDDPSLVELRRSLHPGPLLGLTAALETPVPPAPERWPELSRPVRVLPPPLLLAYLALHASRYFYATMLVRLAELVLVVERSLAGRPNAWPEFEALVDRASLRPFVFPALDLAERLAPGTLPPEVHERLTNGAPEWLRERVRAESPGSILEMHPLPPEGKSVWSSPPVPLSRRERGDSD